MSRILGPPLQRLVNSPKPQLQPLVQLLTSNKLNQLFSGGQSLGPMVRFPANSTTTTHDLHLSPVSQQLLCAALSSATQKAYLRSWKRFYEFCHSSNSFFQVPCSLSLICNFIGHLHSSNSSFSCFCN